MEDRRRFYRMLAQYTSIIFVLPSALLVGYFIGSYLDNYFETAPWLSLVFILLGAATGLYEVFRILSRKQ